jgi:hypothetical protein
VAHYLDEYMRSRFLFELIGFSTYISSKVQLLFHRSEKEVPSEHPDVLMRSDSPSPGFSQKPEFWDSLSSSDRAGYQALRSRLITPEFANQRGRSRLQFSKLISIIQSYVCPGSPDAATRSLVCGIARCERGIAVNIQQLARLTSKSKSSINGSLQGLGFRALPTGQSAADLAGLFASLVKDLAELRKWSLRVPETKSVDFDDHFSEFIDSDFF